MNIPKNINKRTKSGSPTEDYPRRYVVSESVIDNFVKQLRVLDLETAIARLQIVSDVTAGMLANPGRNVRAGIERIKRLAQESRERDYQQIMRQIVEAISEGKEGVEAAHRTARRAVEAGFRWSIYYFGALEMYKHRLRRSDLTAERDG